jgi:predicted transcriptional regulator
VILETSWYNSSMKDKQTQHKITLSLPRETWEAMNELARKHQRSFTKELVWALQEYVRRELRRQGE